MLKDIFLTTFKKNKISSIIYLASFSLFAISYIFSVVGFAVPTTAVYFAFACLLTYIGLYAKSHENFKIPFTSLALLVCALFSSHSLINVILYIAKGVTVLRAFQLLAFLCFVASCFALLICGFAGIKNRIVKIVFYCIGLGGVFFLIVANCITLVSSIIDGKSLMTIFSNTISTFFYTLMPLCFYLGSFFEVLLDRDGVGDTKHTATAVTESEENAEISNQPEQTADEQPTEQN